MAAKVTPKPSAYAKFQKANPASSQKKADWEKATNAFIKAQASKPGKVTNADKMTADIVSRYILTPRSGMTSQQWQQAVQAMGPKIIAPEDLRMLRAGGGKLGNTIEYSYTGYLFALDDDDISDEISKYYMGIQLGYYGGSIDGWWDDAKKAMGTVGSKVAEGAKFIVDTGKKAATVAIDAAKKLATAIQNAAKQLAAKAKEAAVWLANQLKNIWETLKKFGDYLMKAEFAKKGAIENANKINAKFQAKAAKFQKMSVKGLGAVKTITKPNLAARARNLEKMKKLESAYKVFKQHVDSLKVEQGKVATQATLYNNAKKNAASVSTASVNKALGAVKNAKELANLKAKYQAKLGVTPGVAYGLALIGTLGSAPAVGQLGIAPLVAVAIIIAVVIAIAIINNMLNKDSATADSIGEPETETTTTTTTVVEEPVPEEEYEEEEPAEEEEETAEEDEEMPEEEASDEQVDGYSDDGLVNSIGSDVDVQDVTKELSGIGDDILIINGLDRIDGLNGVTSLGDLAIVGSGGIDIGTLGYGTQNELPAKKTWADLDRNRVAASNPHYDWKYMDDRYVRMGRDYPVEFLGAAAKKPATKKTTTTTTTTVKKGATGGAGIPGFLTPFSEKGMLGGIGKAANILFLLGIVYVGIKFAPAIIDSVGKAGDAVNKWRRPRGAED